MAKVVTFITSVPVALLSDGSVLLLANQVKLPECIWATLQGENGLDSPLPKC